MNIADQLAAIRVIPVVAIEQADDAAPLADALCEGGLPCMEITFRTPAAADAIRAVCDRDDLILGAGTVLTTDTVKLAMDVGARFIISPGINPAVVEYCTANEIPIFPGVATPTDIQLALGLGLDTVKFFPAEAFGGLKTLKAISAPYGGLRFIPTGGINPDNLAEYLAFAPVLACGGSWMVKKELIRAGEFDTITTLTQEAVAKASRA